MSSKQQFDEQFVEEQLASIARLSAVLYKDFPLELSEGENVVDKAITLLKRYKRMLNMSSLPI
jgi:hypothetical protein